MKLPLSDVHWEPAVILDKDGGKRGDGNIRVGIRDGRVLPLNTANGGANRNLGLYDVVYVRVIEGKTVAKPKNTGGAPAAAAPGGRAELRVRPTVQGAALVLENKTGRILAMAGSFSYFSSQLNRTAQTQRQPGSAMKPLTYLTALQAGLQPNTLVSDDPITLAPIGWHRKHGTIARGPDIASRQEDFWTPRNADGSTGGMLTMRRGLENSVNLVTAHLLADGISDDPEKSLAQVCATAMAAKIYKECIRYYPFVLGAQPVRMIDLAAFYAAVANEGALPKVHAINSIEVDGKMVFQYPNAPLPFIGAADRTSFYQLKTMLQGVVARGTARAITDLSPFVAGKTGTTEDAVDGWFIGFTNDVTVAVWVGYDNSDGKRRSLGTRASGAGVALPIFEPILQAIWVRALRLKPRSTGLRRRPSVIWSICRSITRMEADARGAAVKASSSISESVPMARSKRPNISSRHVRRLPDHARQGRANISSRHVRRLPDHARQGRIHRREKALGGRVLPSPQSEEVMALGAGAAAPLSRTNGTG